MRLLEGTVWDRVPHCERCNKPETDCQCPPIRHDNKVHVLPHHQTARLSVENRKRGKVVTIVKGLPSANNDLYSLLNRLKNMCGAGGTLAGEYIEIQGNHMERIRDILKDIGYMVRS